MSMTTSRPNFWRNSVATLAACTTASGSSPLTWKIWRLDDKGVVGRVGRRAREVRRGGEADLVVDDDMHRSAGAVSAHPGEGKTFGHDALTGKGRVAVQKDRHDLAAFGSLSWSCLARTAENDRFTASRCEGLAVSDRCTLLCQTRDPTRPQGDISHRPIHPRLRA